MGLQGRRRRDCGDGRKAMSVTLVSTRYHVARKSHRCFECGGWIDPGVRYEKHSLTGDGTAWDLAMHPDCIELANVIRNQLGWDYFGSGDGSHGPLIDDIAEDGWRCYEALLDDLRGHYPHAVCRFEFIRQKWERDQ